MSAFMQTSRLVGNHMVTDETNLVGTSTLASRVPIVPPSDDRLGGLGCESAGGGFEIKNHTIYRRLELLVAKGDLALTSAHCDQQALTATGLLVDRAWLTQPFCPGLHQFPRVSTTTFLCFRYCTSEKAPTANCR